MLKKCMFNGVLTDSSKAVVRVNDLALLRGYGIFDYFLFREGRPLFFEDYLDRFYASAHRLHLPISFSRHELSQHVLDLIRANGRRSGGMRLLLTGGYTEDGYQPGQPNLFILQYGDPGHPPARYEDGVKLLTLRHQREIPEVKTINYLMGIQMIPRLRKEGALEPLYHDGSHLRESVRSNIFLVDGSGNLITPSNNILMGITRSKVLALAADICEVEEREVELEEIAGAREAFLTGSTKKVMPVVQIDDQVIGDGKPGEICRQLMDRFDELCRGS
ncbi:MAG: aminotransferase class IV [Saprospiraceae bacterium]|nr:aminotransferase class IV [Saprospiraceae bacterium]